jgi:chemotaxis protein CheD
MTAGEIMVRMGEHAVAADPAVVLVSIGLGSCIGLALVDRRMAVAGLAHVMLPSSPGVPVTHAGKFADLAVPALVDALGELGAARGRLEAVLVGGARMFSFGTEGGMDVGARNDAATRAALQSAGVPIRGSTTGGDRGRTIRVHVADGSVTVKEAGGTDLLILAGRERARTAA